MRHKVLLVPLLLACKEAEDPKAEESCSSDPGTICAWAGTGEAAFDGGGKHRLDSAFYWPMDVNFSPYGKPVVADWNNHKLRMVEDDGTLTTIMGTDFLGDGPTDQSDLAEPGAPGTTVNLNHPTDQDYYPDGRLLSASWHTHKLRTWDPATGLTLVVLGRGADFAGEDYSPASEALANQPKTVVIDSHSNAYFVDMRNERVRILTADMTVATIAGNGEKDDCGDDGPATEACLNFPKAENPEPGGGLALSADESKLYIADTENHRIRVVDLASGTISAFAGTGEPGYSGDGGAAASAQLNYPRDIAIDPVEGRLYVADTENQVIRAIDLDNGTISTVAGSNAMGNSGDGGPALEATLYRPFGVSVDEDGLIYISDTFNHRIRMVWP